MKIGTSAMTTINDYFDKVIVVNLKRRPDRWFHVLQECRKHGLTMERFEAIDPGKHDGNTGCTASHGAVLRYIAEQGWQRTLVFEDDFEFRFHDSQQMFGNMMIQVPSDWFLVYLGGHYGSDPVGFVAPNVVRTRHIKTTSSYGVTLEAARKMWPLIHGVGPIDELYLQFQMAHPCYIFEPRLCVQYTNYSDLQRRVSNHEMCMTDTGHIDRLRQSYEVNNTDRVTR